MTGPHLPAGLMGFQSDFYGVAGIAVSARKKTPLIPGFHLPKMVKLVAPWTSPEIRLGPLHPPQTYTTTDCRNSLGARQL